MVRPKNMTRWLVQPFVCDEGRLPFVAFFMRTLFLTPANVDLVNLSSILLGYQLGNER